MERNNMILIVSFLNCIQEKNMKGQVRGQGEANHKQILWWPALYTRSTYGKTPLLHWHQKKKGSYPLPFP